MSVNELQTLKNALINNQGYIGVVLNVHGALRGIIRELTGNYLKICFNCYERGHSFTFMQLVVPTPKLVWTKFNFQHDQYY